MRIGLGRRYAVYLAAFTLGSITLTLLAAGLIALRQADILQEQIHDAIATVQGANEDARLRGTAQYLSGQMFNPVFRMDVERIDEEVARVRHWLPVSSFLVTDAARRVITDGSEAKLSFGDTLAGEWPTVEQEALLLTDAAGKRQIRFAIRSGDTLAGFAALTLADELSAAELRRIDEQTSNLWSNHRSSLLALFLIAFTLSIALGAAASARLSRSLSQPLADMSRAAAAFAKGNLDHPLPTGSTDELGELARALRTMAQDVRAHEADVGRKNAELERFAYTVSHDLKSPLVTIRSFTGAIAAELGPGAPERIRQDLGRILGASEKMQNLLADLLELSRVGRVVNPVEDVAFGDLAREAVELLHGLLTEKRVEVTIEEGLPSVRVDRKRIVEVLQNLLENASKFIAPGREPRVAIGRRSGTESTFFVRDNGQGVDPAYAERIFNIFEKLDPKAEGTGIGLSLVKRIVEAHGGRIWVEQNGSDPGATFVFTLGPDCFQSPGSSVFGSADRR